MVPIACPPAKRTPLNVAGYAHRADIVMLTASARFVQDAGEVERTGSLILSYSATSKASELCVLGIRLLFRGQWPLKSMFGRITTGGCVSAKLASRSKCLYSFANVVI